MTEYIEIGRPMMAKSITLIGNSRGSAMKQIESLNGDVNASMKGRIGKYVIAALAIGITLILITEYRKRQKRLDTH